MTPEEKKRVQNIKELRQHYKNVFLSSSGKVVLRHMLSRLNAFGDAVEAGDEEARVLRNYAWELIEMLGGLNPVETFDAIVSGLEKTILE